MIAYAPQTEVGAGFLVLLVKAMMRPLYILGAVNNHWPMSLEMALADLEEAHTRAAAMRGHGDLLTAGTITAITDWQVQLADARSVLTTAIGADQHEALIADHETAAPLMVNLAQQTWALLSLLDQELMGYRENETDPGQRP